MTGQLSRLLSVTLWCYNSVTSFGSEQPGLESWARTCGCMGDGGPGRKVTLTAALPKNEYHMHTVSSGEQTLPANQPLAEGSLCAPPTRYMDSVTKSKGTNRRQ